MFMVCPMQARHASSVIQSLAPALPALFPAMTTAQAATATQAIVKSHVQLQVLHTCLDLGSDKKKAGSSPGIALARKALKHSDKSTAGSSSVGSGSSASGSKPAFDTFRLDHIAAASFAAAAAAETRQQLKACSREQISSWVEQRDVLLPQASLLDLEKLAYSVTVYDWTSNPGPTKLLLSSLVEHTTAYLTAHTPAAATPLVSHDQHQGDLAALTSLLISVARSKWRQGDPLCTAAAGWVLASQVSVGLRFFL